MARAAGKVASRKKTGKANLRLVEGGEIRTLAFRKAADILRGYDAGKRGRRTEGWTTGGSAANGEITQSLTTIRNRARDLVRNNPYASRAIDMLTAKKIGTGIRARPEKGATVAWEEFCETCDYEGDLDLYGIQSMMSRAADESGEILVRRIRKTSGRVPLQLQILESDYLDSSRFGPTKDGNYIIAGVEIDRRGVRQAFWLYDQHPGESLLLPRSLESKRVEASEIIHFYEKRRPGQLRGMSRLAASMMRLRDLDDYEDAQLTRKKIEACFVAFVTGGNPNKPLGEARTDAETQKRIETLSPGIVEYLDTGEAVTFGNPSTSDDSAFTKHELRAIGAGAGVTYEQLTGDLSGVNFSSIRAGVADFKDLVELWRWIYFMPMAMRRVKDWFLDAAYAGGGARSPHYGFIWTPPAWPYVNPVDDIKAIKEEVKGGLQSLSEKIRERGYDPAVVMNEIIEERKEFAKEGLVFDTDAANTQKAAISPEQAAADKAAADQVAKDKAADQEAARGLMRAQTVAANRKPEPTVINVAAPVVTIAEGAIRAGDTTVNAPAPQVNVDVAPPEVRNEVHPAPLTVNNMPAVATIAVTEVHRDAEGDMKKTVTETRPLEES